MQDALFIAYIDPGFLGSLYQLVFVVLFGTVLGWLLKPWHLLRAWLSSMRKSKK